MCVGKTCSDSSPMDGVGMFTPRVPPPEARHRPSFRMSFRASTNLRSRGEVVLQGTSDMKSKIIPLFFWRNGGIQCLNIS